MTFKCMCLALSDRRARMTAWIRLREIEEGRGEGAKGGR
jgi:hypothetical protein